MTTLERERMALLESLLFEALFHYIDPKVPSKHWLFEARRAINYEVLKEELRKRREEREA
jgi:hypothetical protein